MEYVLGSVAALVSGNVTPSRPKLKKRALTPVKHQPSPNVTPKSEFTDDRSIFLSPSLQKKKAIVKKSPKRIFQNPDLDVTVDEANNSVKSPKVDKAKKHLKEDLESENADKTTVKSPKKRAKDEVNVNTLQESLEKSSKKKKKCQSAELQFSEKVSEKNVETSQVSPKKKKKSFTEESTKDNHEDKVVESVTDFSPKKNKKAVKEETINEDAEQDENVKSDLNNVLRINSKKKKRVKKKGGCSKTNENDSNIGKLEDVSINKATNEKANKKQKKSKINVQTETEIVVNPNAITNQDTDSEHESDHEIQSEDENKEALNTGPADSSDDEEVKKDKQSKTKKSKDSKTGERKAKSPEEEAAEVRKTLFVGNVLFKPKTKKEIKKLFSEYGDIDTVRIRAIPVKNPSITPKLAIIKNELHPERSTVNVYVKFRKADSVEKALAANNKVLNGYHLRVTRSDVTGAVDNKCSVFIGNVPFSLEDETLRSKFEKCGEIESVRLIRDEKTNVGKGFGYVNFKSKDAVELALALSEEDLTIGNRVLRVSRCNQNGNRKGGAANNKKVTGRYGNDKNNRPFGNKRDFGNNRNFGNKRDFGNNRNFGNNRDGNNSRFGGKFNSNNQGTDGAYRRIANKRKNMDEVEGPANKQPKKQRKEFVGRTAEKKKKHTFNKGQKKKRVLSEILSK